MGLYDRPLRCHGGSGGDFCRILARTSRAAARTDRILAAKGNDALMRLLVALQAGRIDALVENAPVVYYTARQQNLEPTLLQEAGAPKQGVRLYVPFSPARRESATYAHIFDQGIRELRQSGRLQEILTSYGLHDWSDQALEMQQP